MFPRETGAPAGTCTITCASEKEPTVTERQTYLGNVETTADSEEHTIKDWADLGQEMWSYLTGKGAAINYSFIDMVVEVPRDIGPDAPRALWKLNGTLRVTTSDEKSLGADPYRG
jgi:hypothetical protein